MKKNYFILPFLILSLLFGALIVTNVQPVITSMNSSWAKTIPVIDGTFTESEWADATHLSFYHDTPSPGHDPDDIHIYIKNTESTLYLLFDDLPDTTEEVDDHLWVALDANLDDVIDNNLTMYLDRDHSSTTAGNDFADWVIGFGSSIHKETAHSIMEVAISITFETVYDGVDTPAGLNNILPVGTESNSIKVFFSAAHYFCGWEIPEDGDMIDVGTFATLTLDATPPMKTYVIVLIAVGGIVLVALIVGGILIIKRKKT